MNKEEKLESETGTSPRRVLATLPVCVLSVLTPPTLQSKNGSQVGPDPLGSTGCCTLNQGGPDPILEGQDPARLSDLPGKRVVHLGGQKSQGDSGPWGPDLDPLRQRL